MKPHSSWFETLARDRLLAEVSVWSADLLDIRSDLRRLEGLGDMLHLDVSDGHFSPALLIFPDLVAAIRAATPMPLHVHLMASDDILRDQISQFADAGADLVSIHAENENPRDAIALITGLGLKAGLVLQLFTPVSAATPFLDDICILTLLGTEIGVKGKGLDDRAEGRLRDASRLISEAGRKGDVLLAADGAIRERTVPVLHRAGADTIVMGSLAFGSADLADRIAWVREMKR